MNSVPLKERAPKIISVLLTLLLALSLVPGRRTAAQTVAPGGETKSAGPQAAADSISPWFRLKREPVAGGAEVLTVFGSLNGLAKDGPGRDDVPLVSVLRDTLGDADPENDRLRHVWMLTYTRPTAGQRIASAVPFLYGRVGNKKRAGMKGPPPPVIDLASPESDVWRNFMWVAAQTLLFNPYGVIAKTSVQTFRRNSGDYRKAHII
ncbi:MAG: hypothetical protein ACRD68_01545, partial [Pyrinomonadaceae bacterium]